MQFHFRHAGWKVRLVVNNYLDDTTSDNIVGVINGSEEPDRYVIICNHRDAWGYGGELRGISICCIDVTIRLINFSSPGDAVQSVDKGRVQKFLLNR